MLVAFDIETQELIPAGGALESVRISVAGVRTEQGTLFFTEQNISELFDVLDSATLIIGHNLLGFDYRVLQRYAKFNVFDRYAKKTFDTLAIVLERTDRRVRLNDLAQRNLGIEKSGSGSDAPMLFKEGKFEQLQAYLQQDLEICWQLYACIQRTGKIKYGHVTYKEAQEREIILSSEKHEL